MNSSNIDKIFFFRQLNITNERPKTPPMLFDPNLISFFGLSFWCYFSRRLYFCFVYEAEYRFRATEAWSLLDTKFRRLLLIRSEPELLKLCKYFNFNESFFHVRIGFSPITDCLRREIKFPCESFSEKRVSFPFSLLHSTEVITDTPPAIIMIGEIWMLPPLTVIRIDC